MTGRVYDIPGEIVAHDVSFDDYMAVYAASHCEWMGGTVIRMSPVHERHDALTRYLALLFSAYFDLRPVGRIRQAPFVMRLAENLAREPDMQIILAASYDRLKPTMMDGAADICIEVVSLESVERDYGHKFAEYEATGVPEYWLIDPIRAETRFFRLSAERHYRSHLPDASGDYHTPALPGFRLHVPLLWQDPLPGFSAIAQAVQAMLS